MADNVIQVILRSVNEMSADLKRIDTDLAKLQGTTESTGASFGKATQSTRLFQRDLLPLRSLLIQITGITGGFGSALFNLIRFGFTPVGIAITAIIASVGFLAKAWSDAAKTAEDLSKVTDALSKQIALGNIEYRAMTGAISEANAMAQKFSISQAELLTELTDRVEKMRRSWGQFLLEFRGIAGLGPSLADIFKLPTVKETEEELEKFRRGMEITREQIKKTGEAQPVIAFTKSLKEQIVQLETQRREMTLGTEAMIRYSLEQRALAQKLDIKNFSALTDEIIRRTFEVERLRIEWKNLIETTKGLEAFEATQEEITEAVKKGLEEWKNKLDELADAERSLTNIILDGVEMRKEGLEKEIFQIARWESEQIEALEKLKEKYPELATSINESMASINEQALRKTTEAIKRSQKDAEQIAADLAKSFTDRFIAMMEGEKADILGFFRDLGRTMVSEMLQEMLAAMLLEPVKEQMKGGARPKTTASLLLGQTMGLFGFGNKEDTRSLEETAKADLAKLTEKIGSAAVRALDTVGMVTQDMEQGIQLLAATGLDAAALNLTGASASLQGAATALVNAASTLSIAAGGSGGGGGKLPFIGNVSNLFGGGLDLGPFERTGGEFDFNWLFSGKGGYLPGNFIPVAALRKFQKGGVANRPTIGVIGEEGDEIVARMKPARPQDSEARGVSVIIQGDIVPR